MSGQLASSYLAHSKLQTVSASKPAVIPEIYNGDKSWDDWIYHFDNIATMCKWDDATKLKLLSVSLTGRAGTMFRRLPMLHKVVLRRQLLLYGKI